MDNILRLEDRIWIVILQEALVYLLVFGRWVLPRVDLSRMALADLLLDYFGKASDIMELYALFDEEVVRTNLLVTYIILTTWSVSFLQFIPVLVHNHKHRVLENVRAPCISRSCFRYSPEIFDTCATFILQDGPFLSLRLFVMIKLDLFTYSLVFFVIKNAFMLILLTYRFVILCCTRPCGCLTACKYSIEKDNCESENKKESIEEAEESTCKTNDL